MRSGPLGRAAGRRMAGPVRFGRPGLNGKKMAVMRRIGLLALLVAAVLVPSVTNAQGKRRGGMIQTPYGSANMNSPEWKRSGGDFRIYQQIMQQKQMMLQQRAMIKQRQAFLKQQKKGDQAQPSSPVAARPAVAPKSKKKRPTRKANPASVSAPKAEAPSEKTKP